MPPSACTKLSPAPNCERSLKAAYLQHCVQTGSVRNSWLLSSEYRLDGSARRADLAILGDGRFVGIEFKSQRDSIKRLAGQMAAYIQVFDAVILVVAEKHTAQALAQAPAPVTVYVAKKDGSLHLARESAAGSACTQCNRSMAQNLTKAQLLAMVMHNNRRASRNQLLALADELPIETVRAAMLSAFEIRYGTTSRQFWRRAKGKTVKIDHLEALSRYAKRRKVWQQHKSRNDRFWADWSKRASLHFKRPDQSSQSSSVSYFPSESL